VLTPTAPRSGTAPPATTVGIDRIELPDYLMRPELVTRAASNQLTIAGEDVWGEPIKDGFARTLRHDLESELGGARVATAPFEPATRPDLAVDVEVQRFERVAGAGALLEARWTVRDVKAGTVVAQRQARLQQPARDGDAHAAVAALSRDVAALAAEIAGVVRTNVSQRH